MESISPDSGRKRFALSLGALLITLVLGTAAAITDTKTSLAQIDGTRNLFNIMVAGSIDPEWTPQEAVWAEGNPESYRINLRSSEQDGLLSPGAELALKIAVKNDSPQLNGTLGLQITDPDPLGNEIDVHTGSYKELYDVLLFTVKDENEVYLDRTNARELSYIAFHDLDFKPGSVKEFDIIISMPEWVDNRWQLATTGIDFRFEAESL